MIKLDGVEERAEQLVTLDEFEQRSDSNPGRSHLDDLISFVFITNNMYSFDALILIKMLDDTSMKIARRTIRGYYPINPQM